jgi:osmoprotectant transport system substrate-binding protein
VESRRRAGWIGALVALLVAVAACSGEENDRATTSALGDDAITIASFDFAESEVLAEIYSQALESEGLQVRRALRLGPRELVMPALAAGLVELVPEYAGTALQFASAGETAPSGAAQRTHDALRRALEDRPIVALAAAPAQDANAVVVTPETAQRYHLEAVSDLADVAPTLSFGGPPECPTRPLCLLGLSEIYGLEFGTFVGLDVGGPVTRQALERGDIDVALLFTTDPSVDDLVVLRDDRGLQPAENVVPLVRREVVDRWGQPLVATVDAVSAALTTEVLRSLNAEMGGGRPASEVATAWLAGQEIP